MKPAPPSRNPTNDDSLIGLFDVVLRKFLQGVDNMLPAQVISFDRAKNLAQVRPLIAVVTTDNVIVRRAEIQSVPVHIDGAGGFMSNFPIQPGDLGLLKANDRDISLFKNAWQEAQPNTARMHSFSDAVFHPCIFSGFTISAADLNNYVLQSLDGSIRFAVGRDHTCISDQPAYTQSPNAVLDVQSTTKAFKLPRMTSAQKLAIPSPQAGFMVFDTDGPGVSVYDGSSWS